MRTRGEPSPATGRPPAARTDATVVAIVDYGAGNLRSVEFALDRLGVAHRRAASPRGLEGAAALVLPGVGAAASAMEALEARGLVRALRRAADGGRGVPLLGICLGMQLLTETSDEGGERVRCLGLLPGETRRFRTALPLPQIGWNRTRVDPDPLFEGLGPGRWFYFNHAHRVSCDRDRVTAEAEYGEPFPAAVRRGRLAGVQFHPEKSAASGLAVLANFCREAGLPVPGPSDPAGGRTADGGEEAEPC